LNSRVLHLEGEFIFGSLVFLLFVDGNHYG
jgi:hypothetical protein